MPEIRIEFHPAFAQQYESLAELAATSDQALEWFSDVQSLLNALETHGHGVESENHVRSAISHPIVTSRYQTFALRRTPPTAATPTSIGPPILRVPYVWFNDETLRQPLAVVMLIGDKSKLGNDWYPQIVQRIDNSMIPDWERTHPTHHVRPRR